MDAPASWTAADLCRFSIPAPCEKRQRTAESQKERGVYTASTSVRPTFPEHQTVSHIQAA